ncbi:hypothetical protein [Silvibacterium acidisoli]|uniref:hypothetical protein n=1 Tax=Acidobacteriaceae bacterium ZG23-2 TaxID=2883246 RepID=UPI00406CE1E2
MKRIALPSFIFAVLLCCSLGAVAQTSITSLTGNNTAACPASSPLPTRCQAAYSGQTDSASGVATQLYDRPAGNVSDEDLHQYLTNGAETKIFANFMLGFCTNNVTTTNGVQYCDNNVVTGYTSNNANTVAAQAQDLINRHIDGAVMTWEGPGTSEDQATLAFQSYVDQNHCTGPQQCSAMYLIMDDGPDVNYSVTSTGAPGTSGAACPTSDSPTTYETCVVQHLRNDMCYMNGYHWGNNAYQKWNGHPVVQVFPYESGTPIPATGAAPSWADVWAQIADWNSNLGSNCGSAPYNADNGVPVIIFENAGGFSHEAASGSYYWIEPDSGGATNQFVYNISPASNTTSLDYFYQTAQNFSSDMVWGAGFKGFNDAQSQWGANRIMDQACGQTWLNSLTASNGYFTGSPLPFLEVDTWNDYNEGTEIESGIDNCYTTSGSISGSTLTWNLNPTNSSMASLSTVSHVEIYESSDGGSTMTLLASPAAAATGSYTLDLPSGSYQIYVRMVGKNSILNRMSSPITYAN